MDVRCRHPQQPRQAFILILEPGTLHDGLGVVSVAGDAFDGILLQGDDTSLAMSGDGRKLHAEGLRFLGC